jgi:hypothetical protein
MYFNSSQFSSVTNFGYGKAILQGLDNAAH